MFSSVGSKVVSCVQRISWFDCYVTPYTLEVALRTANKAVSRGHVRRQETALGTGSAGRSSFECFPFGLFAGIRGYALHQGIGSVFGDKRNTGSRCNVSETSIGL